MAKANYALDHGEIGIGSKLETQLAFDQTHFLPSMLLNADLAEQEKVSLISSFAQDNGLPLILKPDMGCVGKGVIKLGALDELTAVVRKLSSDYIVQKYTPHKHEFGVFFVRYGGKGFISGINRKHFPEVTGDSVHSLQQLAEQHPRFTAHWDLFMQYVNREYIPAKGERVRLSFIGSHTMGCKFTNDSELHTPELDRAILAICDSQPGFNFGRLDVKAQSEAAFRAGDFVVIEVNGVASLPTHMFDPKHSVGEGYQIFFEHARHLVKAAVEQRHQSMTLLPLREVMRQAGRQQTLLNEVHQQSLESKNAKPIDS